MKTPSNTEMPKAHQTNTQIWTSLVETGVAILTVQHTPSNVRIRWLSRNQTTAQRTMIYFHTDQVLLNFSKALLIWQCSNISSLLRYIKGQVAPKTQVILLENNQR